MPDEQGRLFETGRWWENEWQSMPEFIQNDLTPYKSIKIHFPDKEAMIAFASLVKQTVTPNTRCIWYPQAEIGYYANKVYVDEDDDRPDYRLDESTKLLFEEDEPPDKVTGLPDVTDV